MAKKPVAAAAVHDLPPEMDYAEHEKTYSGFMTLTKWAVIATALFVVLLYFAIKP